MDINTVRSHEESLASEGMTRDSGESLKCVKGALVSHTHFSGCVLFTDLLRVHS